MSATRVQEGPQEVELRDPAYVARLLPALRLATRTWFRSSVTGMEHVPEGAALLVSNHSGGVLPVDVPIIACAFIDQFSVDRPLHVLAHDLLFTGPVGEVFKRCGFLPADREHAHAVLTAGSVTIVFPGGDHDALRPTRESGRIDFAGRVGYVRTALRAGVPIVPVVGIGGQEASWFLTRAEAIGRLLRLEKLIRTRYLPISVGFPFGLVGGGFPVNLPLPTKITTRVLPPIDPATVLGPNPDVAEVDELVRARMQQALDELVRERRLPVLG